MTTATLSSSFPLFCFALLWILSTSESCGFFPLGDSVSSVLFCAGVDSGILIVSITSPPPLQHPSQPDTLPQGQRDNWPPPQGDTMPAHQYDTPRVGSLTNRAPGFCVPSAVSTDAMCPSPSTVDPHFAPYICRHSATARVRASVSLKLRKKPKKSNLNQTDPI